MLKPLLAALALAGGALGAPALAADAPAPKTADAPESITWRVATPWPAASLHTETLLQFAREVESASEGRLKVEVKPDASLKSPAVKRAVQRNAAQLGDVALAELQSEWPGFGLDSLPFLARGHEPARRLYQAQRVPLGKQLSGQGVVMLYSIPSPPVGLALKQPAADLPALRGLAWGTWSPAGERMAKLVGAKPVALPEAQAARALHGGQLQAALVPAEALAGGTSAEGGGVFLDLQAWAPRHGVLMNVKAFEALDKSLRKVVVKAALAAEKRGWEQSEARHRRALARLKDVGVEVAEPPEALLTGLRKTVGEPFLDDWLQRAGAPGRLMLDEYRR
ncbi:TRAP transporter substrate-binding protein DctP [Azohydromonas aeria]|uniref:TRAP transporter substrate-binding protein DctP n=1 Tax=Azohydromonas aeria TaxID=2590212 RepID=UPI0012F8D09F|nr:TRAP transporter substrate-binding protein DctP [Azohydromonas aeria]